MLGTLTPVPLGPTPCHRSRQHLPPKIQRARQVRGRGQQWRTLTRSRDVRHAAAAAAAFAGAASGPAAAPPLGTIGAAAVTAAAALCHPSAPRACSLLAVAHVMMCMLAASACSRLSATRVVPALGYAGAVGCKSLVWLLVGTMCPRGCEGMPPPLALEHATDTPACTADGSRSSLVPQSWHAVTREAGEQPPRVLRGSAQVWTGTPGPAGPERACTSCRRKNAL